MSKKKRKIAIISIILIILSVLSIYKILDLTSYHFVKAKAVNYLSDKYDADKDEFELVDYKHSKLYISSSGEWVQHLAFSDFSFEFKYKNKSFFVNKYKGKFYDDYQIDDIEKWCTEWLQQKVDNNINGIAFDSISIADYLKRTHKSNKYIISENNAEEFVMNCYPEKGKPTFISYHMDDFNYDEQYGIRDTVSQIINEELSSKNQFKAAISQHTEMSRGVLKSEDDYWIIRYSF